MIDLQKIDPKLRLLLRQNGQETLEAMRSIRMSWWSHWAALAEMFLPRRYRWFISPNQYIRGVPINQAIVDETGLLAARILGTGLMSGLTSPTKPWFRFELSEPNAPMTGATAIWLQQATQITLDTYAQSNFYSALAQAYMDDVVFGSAALIQYEDKDKTIHFYNPCLGEFFFGLNEKQEVCRLAREYTYTVEQTVNMFGLENVSESTRIAYKNPTNRQTEIVVCSIIEPNDVVYERGGEAYGYALPKKFKFREIFWEQGMSSGQVQGGSICRLTGFNSDPFAALRWDVTSNDPYGRSPGMDALPATRQLQIEQRRKAEAIDKMVRPPMKASVSMKNEPVDILPGGITYVNDMGNQSGFAPAFTVEPRVGELMEDLKEVQARVCKVFFNDLFLGISQLGTVRTATEIEARQQETLVQIGPVIERTEGELNKIVERTFEILSRKKLFPPAPKELQGKSIAIKYVSLFAETQRAASTQAIERLLALVGNMAGIQPDILDTIDTDKLVDTYADQLNVPPDLLRDAVDIAKIRAQRQQVQQQAAALQTGQAAAQGAQTLSQTDVGGGKNALQAMLGANAGG